MESVDSPLYKGGNCDSVMGSISLFMCALNKAWVSIGKLRGDLRALRRWPWSWDQRDGEELPYKEQQKNSQVQAAWASPACQDLGPEAHPHALIVCMHYWPALLFPKLENTLPVGKGCSDHAAPLCPPAPQYHSECCVLSIHWENASCLVQFFLPPAMFPCFFQASHLPWSTPPDVQDQQINYLSFYGDRSRGKDNK